MLGVSSSIQDLGVALALSAAVLFVGCESLLGHGDEVARTEVTTNQPFTLQYVPRGDTPEQLWLIFDVEFEGRDFSIEGPIEVYEGETLRGTWHLDLGRKGAPLAESEGRKEIGTREIAINQHRSLSSTVHLLELRPSQNGQPLTIRGKWDASKTQINELILLVTH